MSRIEKVIVVVLGLVSLSLVIYIVGSWTSQRTAAAPKPEVAATVTPPLQNAVLPPPPAPAPQAQPSAETQAGPAHFLRAKEAVTRGLKDPDSARFGKIFTGRGGRTICGEVNARNGYGGYNGMTPFAYSVDTGEAAVVTIGSIKHMQPPASDFIPKVVKDYFRDCRGEE